MFVKGKSGNPAGRKPGSIRLATLEASVQWRDLLRDLLLSVDYQRELKARLLAGTLPPVVEAKLYAYAFGEAPKAPDDRQSGMVVNLGFLQVLRAADQPGNPVTQNTVMHYVDHRNEIVAPAIIPAAEQNGVVGVGAAGQPLESQPSDLTSESHTRAPG